MLSPFKGSLRQGLFESTPESGEPGQRIRNTSVWRKVDGRWLCVHNHEDVVD